MSYCIQGQRVLARIDLPLDDGVGNGPVWFPGSVIEHTLSPEFKTNPYLVALDTPALGTARWHLPFGYVVHDTKRNRKNRKVYEP